MDRLRKLYQKAQVSPWNYSYKDLCWLVKEVGFEFSGESGDHRIYKLPGIIEIINLQNVKGKAKPYQIKQVLSLIEKYNLIKEEGGDL